jgi:hypothetical protein
MVDPKPLFDDEETVAPAPARVTVRPLDLDLDPAPSSQPPAAVSPLDLPEDAPVAPPPVAVAPLVLPEEKTPALVAAPVVIGLGEHPYVAQAMKRGAALFPALMTESGFLVRNCLGQLIPLDFTRLSHFAGDTLARSAGLVGQVADLNRRFHEIDAQALVTGIVSHARDHAAGSGHSVIGMLKTLKPFDDRAARTQLLAIRTALEHVLAVIEGAGQDVTRTERTLGVEAATLAILNDMGDHGTMGDLLARRAAMVQTALQETGIALTQIGTLIQLTQQWILRSDEVANVTLPALGFSRSL